MTSISSLFFLGLATLFFLFFLAQFLKYNFKGLNDFKSIAIVILLTTTVYACIKSHFASYLIIVLLLFTYLFLKQYIYKQAIRSEVISPQIAWNQSLMLLIFYYSFSFFGFNIHLTLQQGSYSSLHPDFSFYAGISELLSTRGTESIIIDPVLDGQKGYTFYHYFELWFNGLVSSLLGKTHLQSLMFITLPIFSTVMLYGVYTLTWNNFRSSFSSKYVFTFLPLVILFVFPFTTTLRWVMSFGKNSDIWNVSIISVTAIKYIIVLTGLLFLIIDYKSNRLNYVVPVLVFIGIVYPPTLIAIIPSIICWLVLNYRHLQKHVIVDSVVTILIVFIVFYRIQTSYQDKSVHSTSLISLIKQYFTADSKRLFLFLSEPLSRTIYIAAAFIPIIIPLLIERNLIRSILKRNKLIIGFFLIAYLLSIMGIVLLDFTYDGDQLHTNIFYPLYIFLFYLGLILLIFRLGPNHKRYGLLLLVITLALNIYGYYADPRNAPRTYANTVFFERITKTLSLTNGRIAYIADSNYFKSARHKNIYLGIPAPNLRFYSKEYFPHCLSLDRIRIVGISDTFNFEKTIKSAHYYKDIIDKKLTYSEVFRNDTSLKVIILHKDAPEIKDAQTVFGVTKIGEIDPFSYYIRN